VAVARGVLEQYKATDGLFPTGHLPSLRERALARYADVIERLVGNS
jgi:acyl-CoA dehydrogenase